MATDFDTLSSTNDPEFVSFVQAARDKWLATRSTPEMERLRKAAQSDPKARAEYTRVMKNATRAWWDEEGRKSWEDYASKSGERAAVGKNDADRTAAEGRTAKINADIDAFYQELAKPLDPNDPEVMRVASMAGRQAAGESFGRGIEGGLAVENTQRMAGDAAANLFAQERARRQGLQAQLGGLRSQTGLSQQDYLDRQRQFGVEQQRYRDGLNYENEMGQWMQRQQQGQAVGSIVGGGLGGLVGGLAGGPAGAGLGISAGAGLGGGLGGLGAGGPPPRRFNSGGW